MINANTAATAAAGGEPGVAPEGSASPPIVLDQTQTQIQEQQRQGHHLQQDQYQHQAAPSAASAAASASGTVDAQRDFIIKKYSLQDILPRGSDFDTAKANLLPSDGSSYVFAGGKPITKRKESSSPAVEEALARGFKLAHHPARALVPEDQFKHHNNPAASGITPSPDPAMPSRSASSSSSHASPSIFAPLNYQSQQQQQQQQQQNATGTISRQTSLGNQQRSNNNQHQRHNNNPGRIPGNISPHVLPRGLLMKPLPAPRELLEMQVPLQETTKYRDEARRFQRAVDYSDWADVSDPTRITELGRTFRRCFPRTAKDDEHDSLPTSYYSGNYILRRYGGNFPKHGRYEHYRKYSEFGLNASTSEFHNWPNAAHPYKSAPEWLIDL